MSRRFNQFSKLGNFLHFIASILPVKIWCHFAGAPLVCFLLFSNMIKLTLAFLMAFGFHARQFYSASSLSFELFVVSNMQEDVYTLR